MFTTIVVGTNWSATAEAAFAKALDLARLTGARLHVVSATAPSPSPVSAGGDWTARPDFHADVVLQGTLDRLGGEADPAEAILTIADQCDADLIVVGNKGMHRRVLGSIPNTVSHRAGCDVLIVQTT